MTDQIRFSTFSPSTAQYEVKARLPQPDTVKRGLRSARAQHRPKDPSSLQELYVCDVLYALSMSVSTVL